MLRYLIFFIALLCWQSCATFQPHFPEELEKGREQEAPSHQKIEHTIYLAGDFGASGGRPEIVLGALEQKLAAASEQSSLIFLGNSVPSSGMPDSVSSKRRIKAERLLNQQLAILKNYKGQAIFLAGNHEWARYGARGVKETEHYIEQQLRGSQNAATSPENYFYSDNACADPQIIKINDKLVILVVHSAWWLKNWKKAPEINDGCLIKNRTAFLEKVSELLRKNQHKNVVVAMHHPLYSVGEHSGYSTAFQNLFPFTQLQKNLYIPMPILGSFYHFLRSSIGSKQDLYHQNYEDLRDGLIDAAQKNGEFIFVAGHDHNLQYLEEDDQHFIVSGSGAKVTATIKDDKTVSICQRGFAQLDFYEDGTTWMSFWGTIAGQEAKLLFKQKIKGALELLEDKMPTSFPIYEKNETKKTTHLLNYDLTKKGPADKFFLGQHYRELYQQKYDLPVLDLATFRGGMSVIRRGNGSQTNFLRMMDKEGRAYTFRALTKDAKQYIIYPYNKVSVFQSIVQDKFLAIHPFAPLAIASLAESCQIYHTHPALYYVPKQPILGVHNDMHGDQVYLVEEHPDEVWKNQHSFGYSDKIIKTETLLERLIEGHQHKVDQPFTLRNRLLDIIIGDWDRYDDQWRWARFKLDDENYQYRPIPRDRDQAFTEYDGLITKIARKTHPVMKQFKPYHKNLKNVKWEIWSARHFDASFLNGLTWEEWEQQVDFLQNSLTDENIEKAFDTWPETAQQLTKSKIVETLKKRRDNLKDLARQYYKETAKAVDICGTAQRERFEVERLNNHQTRVKVFVLKSKKENTTNATDTSKIVVYDRLFNHDVTKEIRLYGESGDDEFYVSGVVDDGIIVRLIGGLGNDFFVNQSTIKGIQEKTICYDNRKNTAPISRGVETKALKTRNPVLNFHDRKAPYYDYNYATYLPVVGYNSDEGGILGLSLSYYKHGFKKEPYAQKHYFSSTLALATFSSEFNYIGEFRQIMEEWDLVLENTIRNRRYSFNFFGWGNEAVFDKSLGIDYYRVRQSKIFVHPKLRRTIAGGDGAFSIGPLLDRTSIAQTPERYIVSDDNGLEPSILQNQWYGGAKAHFYYENEDNKAHPTRGIKFHLESQWQRNLLVRNEFFRSYSSRLAVYQNIGSKKRVIFASQLSAAHIAGDFQFFHAPSIGGELGLRENRFYGNTSFNHSTELRWTVLPSDKNKLLSSFGVSAGFNYGRVWWNEESSSRWHLNYGGTIWVIPLDVIVISAGLFYSDEDIRIDIGLGHAF